MGPPPKKAVAAKAKAKVNGNGNGSGAAKAAPAPTAAGPKASAPAPSPSKNAVRQTAKLEKAVETAEAALAVLEVELAAPEAWATQYESAKSTARHTAAKRAVEDAYALLEEHLEKTEA
jgi:ATP-binding cassette subfamily F protein 3